MIKLPDLLRTTFHGKNIAIVWRQIQNWNSQKLFLAEKSPSQLYNSDRVSIFKVLETNLWWAACVIICLHTKTLTMESRTWKSSQNIFFTKKIQQWTKTTDSWWFQIARITKISILWIVSDFICAPVFAGDPPVNFCWASGADSLLSSTGLQTSKRIEAMGWESTRSRYWGRQYTLPLPPAISNEGICLLQTTVVPILQKGIILMWKKKCNLLVHFLFFSNSSPTDQRS